MSEELMEKRLLEIFKQKYNQGDSYYCRVNNKGDKFIVGYKNDYPMQHGDGVEWMIPVEVVEMLVSQVEPEVKVNFADTVLQEFLDWNKKYPPHKIFNYEEINKISGELSKIMEKAQKHLGDSKISA